MDRSYRAVRARRPAWSCSLETSPNLVVLRYVLPVHDPQPKLVALRSSPLGGSLRRMVRRPHRHHSVATLLVRSNRRIATTQTAAATANTGATRMAAITPILMTPPTAIPV